MTESLIQRIEKAEKELAALKAEATKVPKVDLSSLKDGVYVCQNRHGQPRIFFLENGKSSVVMGDSERSGVIRQGGCSGLQDSFDSGFYHSLKKVTSLEPLL